MMFEKLRIACKHTLGKEHISHTVKQPLVSWLGLTLISSVHLSRHTAQSPSYIYCSSFSENASGVMQHAVCLGDGWR